MSLRIVRRQMLSVRENWMFLEELCQVQKCNFSWTVCKVKFRELNVIWFWLISFETNINQNLCYIIIWVLLFRNLKFIRSFFYKSVVFEAKNLIREDNFRIGGFLGTFLLELMLILSQKLNKINLTVGCSNDQDTETVEEGHGCGLNIWR